jgi:hypothetical protein
MIGVVVKISIMKSAQADKVRKQSKETSRSPRPAILYTVLVGLNKLPS